MKIPFKSLGNDLFAEFNCTCSPEKYMDSEFMSSIFKTTIKITGYNDAYFFDTVNNAPHEIKCDCGISHMIKWERDGVSINPTSK